MIDQPPMPAFTPVQVDALPLSPGDLVTRYIEGEPIFVVDGTGGRWRIDWDYRNGRWCKRVFISY